MPAPARVGIGYRHPIGDWIRAHLDRFDVLEVTVDHYLYGGTHVRAALESLAKSVPLVVHGVGLSIGTDAPLDEAYVREVAKVVRLLRASRYSEHLAFTKVPGRDLGNLLPLPKTPEVAAWVAEKARRVRMLTGLPFELENVSYLFDWPDSTMSDAAFLSAVCESADAGILLDVENVYVNAHNHALDAEAVLDALPPGRVRAMHMAGGISAGKLLVDSHDRAVPDGALALLRRALTRFAPETIILERDDDLDAFDEMLDDVARIRTCVAEARFGAALANPAPMRSRQHAAAAVSLIERQRALLEFLTTPRAALDATTPLEGLDVERLKLMRDLSLGKRLDKLRSAFPVTLAHLDETLEQMAAEFAIAYPPYDIGRAENARQFADFLTRRWAATPPRRPYVRDLARIELALVQARRPFGADGPTPDARPAVRCRTGAQLLACDHDVQPLFAPHADAVEPELRPVWLAVLPPNEGQGAADGTPRVLEISAELYAALQALDRWRPLDRTDPLGIGAPPELADELAGMGLIEVAA